jgi:alpha-beta hydrolase superfamily lysophospholipase
VPTTIDHGTTRDGLIQLRRRWRPEGDARAAVLILHGIAEHSGRYEHVGDRLASHGLDVVAIDHRGYGRSGGRRGHVDRFSQFLDDVEDQLAQVRTLGLPTVLLGHSMGGLIATNYCVDDRPLPDLLVLSGPAIGKPKVNPLYAFLAPVLGRLFPTMETPDDGDPTILATDPSVGEIFYADPLRVPVPTAALGHGLLSAIDTTRERIEKLTIPTLCLHGGDDLLVPAAASEILEGMANVDRRVIDGLYHEVFNEPVGLQLVDDVVTWLEPHIG